MPISSSVPQRKRNGLGDKNPAAFWQRGRWWEARCPLRCSLRHGVPFLAFTQPEDRSNAPRFSLRRPRALRWSTPGLAVLVGGPSRVVRLRRTLASCAGVPAWSGARPPDLWRGLPTWSGAWPRRRAPKRKSSGLKLFGMSKCAARTQKNRPCKYLGMRALQSMWVSSPLESVFAKTWGGTPFVANGGKSENEVRVPEGDAQFGPAPRPALRAQKRFSFQPKALTISQVKRNAERVAPSALRLVRPWGEFRFP
jgi:hypothetical protein